jgi:hypothetical protein
MFRYISYLAWQSLLSAFEGSVALISSWVVSQLCRNFVLFRHHTKSPGRCASRVGAVIIAPSVWDALSPPLSARDLSSHTTHVFTMYDPDDGYVNSSGPWAETFLPLPADDPLTGELLGAEGGGAEAGGVHSDDVQEILSLSHGLNVRFLRRGSHHVLGDRWTFRVYGGKPMVTGAVTPHNEPQFSARGPFDGNSEITVLGNSFFPGANLLCRLFDGDTNVAMTLQAHYDSMHQVRCITERHKPRPGGELVATIRPCMFKTVQASHNGGVTWSTVSANVRFLFCDIYISTTGSDVAGHGTPDRPYATLQRGIEAALGNPRSYYTYAPKDFTNVRICFPPPRHV